MNLVTPFVLGALLLATACGVGAEAAPEGDELASIEGRLEGQQADATAACEPYGRYECLVLCFRDDKPTLTYNVVVCADSKDEAETQALEETCGRLTTGSFTSALRCSVIR